MDLHLTEKPKEVTIIQGFPGFGMVGSISAEYLCDHLETREIGSVLLPELFPIVAIHQGQVVPPLSIHYHEKGNIVIVKSLTKGKDHEWKFAEVIGTLAKELQAKEIISLEGVNAQQESQDIYAYSSDSKKKKLFDTKGFKQLDEGIVMGVSAALLLKKQPCPITCLFALTTSTLPDSNAAAEIIKALDAYLGLHVEYEPLYEQAKVFEEKIKTILSKSQTAMEEKNTMDYMG